MLKDFPSSTNDLSGERIADRRARQRFIVQWPLQVWPSHRPVTYTTTVNVNSGGFYYLSSELLPEGEMLTAILEIPGMCGDRATYKVTLCCDVQVMRVERIPDNRTYGVACRILNYSVLKFPSAVDPGQLSTAGSGDSGA